jgi:hypothetical protein
MLSRRIITGTQTRQEEKAVDEGVVEKKKERYQSGRDRD